MDEAYRLGAMSLLTFRNTIVLVSGKLTPRDTITIFRWFVERSAAHSNVARSAIEDRITIPTFGEGLTVRSRVGPEWLFFSTVHDVTIEDIQNVSYVWCDEDGDYECVDVDFFRRFRPVSVYRPRVTLKKIPKGPNGWTMLQRSFGPR